MKKVIDGISPSNIHKSGHMLQKLKRYIFKELLFDKNK